MGIDWVLGMGAIGAFSRAAASNFISLMALLTVPTCMASFRRSSFAHGSGSGALSSFERLFIENERLTVIR